MLRHTSCAYECRSSQALMSARGRFSSCVSIDFEQVEGLLLVRADVQTEDLENSMPNLPLTAQKPPLGWNC
jgi:hypothetical protein